MSTVNFHKIALKQKRNGKPCGPAQRPARSFRNIRVCWHKPNMGIFEKVLAGCKAENPQAR